MTTRPSVDVLLAAVALACISVSTAGRYEPDWTSLDSRPLPAWYDRAKFGVFVHWGVYTVPAFGSEWFWMNWKGSRKEAYINFMMKNYKPGFTYQEFGPQFTAEFFDPVQWANIIQDSGAKYVVLTSKHHEGYTLWPSKKTFGWNSVDVGPHKNLVDDLSKAIRSLDTIRFGLYHSLFEWFNPLWLQDKQSNFTTRTFVMEKVLPELYDLVNNYKPEIIWSDGDWEAPDTYWDSMNFLAWLYNDSPVKDTVVVNDRWGIGTTCHHGGYLTCLDRFQPGQLMNRKWENAMTVDKYSWGYRRNSRSIDVYTIEYLVAQLVETVCYGGNLLLNISPTSDGMIPPLHEERLHQMGQWLSINGESIFNSKPWSKCQHDTRNTHLWYTQGNTSSIIYPIFLQWPKHNLLKSACLDELNITSIVMLDTQSKLKWSHKPQGGLLIQLEDKSIIKTQWAWALRIHTSI